MADIAGLYRSTWLERSLSITYWRKQISSIFIFVAVYLVKIFVPIFRAAKMANKNMQVFLWNPGRFRMVDRNF